MKRPGKKEKLLFIRAFNALSWPSAKWTLIYFTMAPEPWGGAGDGEREEKARKRKKIKKGIQGF